MPGGLNEVVQQVGADASRYISEYRAALAVTKELLAANQELARVQGFPGGGGTSGAAAAAADVAKVNAAIREQMGLLNQARTAVGDFGTTAAAAHSAVAGQVDNLGASYEAMRGRISDMAAEALRMNAQMADAATAQITLNQRAVAGYEATRESVRGTTVDLASLRDTAADAGVRVTEAAAAVVAARQAASSGGGTDLMAAMTAAAAAGSGGGAYPWNSTTDAATAAVIARSLAQRGVTSSPNPATNAALAALLGGGGGGGGGGGSGGGGGGGGFFSSFAGGALSGLFKGGNTATDQWRAAAGFIATWYPRIHWAMMGINEVLATVGPAAVAGLAAGAVGLEGGQTAYGRLTGVNAVGQSIGPSLGTTPGQFLGLGDSLQKAQTAADPMVWELMGAAINSVKAATDSASGGLGNFWQLGTNTIAMMDRFGAQVTLDFKHGLGSEMSGAVTGGTQDLQQFGDVLGNVGDTFLKVIPSLPGVGSDLLTTLQVATKGLSDATGVLSSTGLLGPALALEAGSRYGPALVGGVASLIGRTGAGLTAAGGGVIGDVLGTVGHAATAEEAQGLIGVSEGDMVAGTGIAGALGGLGPLQIGGIAAATYLTAKGIGYQTPEQQKVAALQSQIGTDSFTQAYSGIMSGVNQLAPTAVQAPPGAVTQALSPLMELGNAAKHGNLVEGINSIFHLLTDTKPPTAQSVAESGVMKLTQQYQELLSAGQQVSKAFGVSVPEAFTLADQAGLQLSTALGPGGKLSAVSLEQIANAQQGLITMTGGIGSPVYNAGVGAIQATKGLAGSQVSTLNSAYDQILQNAAAGSTAATGFSGGMQALIALGSALPSATAVSPDAAKKSATSIAQALTGFTSPASQAAWAAFSSTSTSAPGILQTVESMMDQLRTAQASGVLGQTQVAGAGAYEARQLLPYAAKSPAALAQLGVLSQEMGGPAYQAGESQKQNLAAISGFLDKASTSAKGYTATQNQMAIGMSNVSQLAQSFGSVMQTDMANTMAGAAASMPKATAAMSAFSASIGSKNLDTGALKTVVSTLKGAGESTQSIQLMIHDIASLHGASPAGLAGIASQVQADIAGHPVKIPVTIDPASALAAGETFGKQFAKAAAPQFGGGLTMGAAPTVTFKSKVDPPVIPHVGNQIYDINGHVHVPPIPKVPNQTFTITGIVNMVGAGSAAMSGGLGNVRFVGQSGFKVPGTGSGDIVPAMLEPGELVVPKGMVAAGAVDHLRGSIPGFASGGLAGQELPSVLTRASSMINSLGSGGASWSSQQWGNMTSTFLQAAQLSHAMGSATGFQGGGIVPGNSLASIKAQIDAAYTKLDALYAANHNKGDAATSAYWSNVLDPLYAAENRLQGTSSPGSPSSPATFSAAKKAAETGQQILAAFQKTLTGEGAPWAAFGKSILQGLEDGIKGAPSKSLADTLVAEVNKEVNYAKSVAGSTNAISQWGSFATGLATPTMTAQGQPYQYYIDQQSQAAGGAPLSVQQNMSDYLQTMQSFQGDIGKLSKAGINKQMLQQIIGAGPLQGDQEAQSILGGAGGVGSANKLWNQINAMSKSLGITAGEGVYGYGGVTGALTGKNVKAGASVTGTSAVHQLQTAIDNLKGKTVVIKVEVDTGTGSSGSLNLSTQQINGLVSQVQAALLKQAKQNRRTGLQLPGYGA